MSPKEMIEVQALEFEKLSKLAMSHYERANAPLENRLTTLEYAKWHKGSAATYAFCAERLRELLKLKGWE
jgi:hypothetical protein